MSNLPIPKIRDTGIFLCWIFGLLLAGILCWTLTRPLRADLLRRSVNRAWTQTGQTIRLQSPISPAAMKPGQSQLGTWYAVDNETRAVVFTLVSGGNFLPCAAIVDSAGIVQNILCLNGSGELNLSLVPDKVKQLYIRRIEGES